MKNAFSRCLFFGLLTGFSCFGCKAGHPDSPQKIAVESSSPSASRQFLLALLAGVMSGGLLFFLQKSFLSKKREALGSDKEWHQLREWMEQNQEKWSVAGRQIADLKSDISKLKIALEERTPVQSFPPGAGTAHPPAINGQYKWEELPAQTKLDLVLELYHNLKRAGELTVSLPKMAAGLVAGGWAASEEEGTGFLQNLFRQFPGQIGIQEPRFKGELQFFLR